MKKVITFMDTADETINQWIADMSAKHGFDVVDIKVSTCQYDTSICVTHCIIYTITP